MGTGDSFPWTIVRRGGREWVGAIPPLPPSAFVACSGTAVSIPHAYLSFHWPCKNHYSLKAYRWIWGTTPSILNLRTRWRRVVGVTFRQL